MENLKYSVIKTVEQYYTYCKIHEDLVFREDNNLEDEIQLLDLLIEKWDNDHNTFAELNPVELLKGLMEENQLKAKDLVEIMGLSKGTISKILNYQKGFSKETIRKLSAHFKIYQEAFNRPYPLISSQRGTKLSRISLEGTISAK
jgi:HTH-type transcriptional regulator/antitoxin HigA